MVFISKQTNSVRNHFIRLMDGQYEGKFGTDKDRNECCAVTVFQQDLYKLPEETDLEPGEQIPHTYNRPATRSPPELADETRSRFCITCEASLWIFPKCQLGDNFIVCFFFFTERHDCSDSPTH